MKPLNLKEFAEKELVKDNCDFAKEILDMLDRNLELENYKDDVELYLPESYEIKGKASEHIQKINDLLNDVECLLECEEGEIIKKLTDLIDELRLAKLEGYLTKPKEYDL